MKSAGQRIHLARTKKGWTLEQLAERAGISKSFLWEVEQGNSDIRGEKLLRVANALGASLDFLLRGEQYPEEYQSPTVQIPRELGELAEEIGLSYRQTLALLEIDQSIVARRSSKQTEVKSKEQWRELYDAVKQFLREDP